MREKISMKPKLLGALALLTMIGALFVMQSADQYTPTADAATGTIHALNVGTCLTTDAKVFKGDCASLMMDHDGTDDDWEIRATNTEVTQLYATYAHDPKDQGGAPRAIVKDSDLIKISIQDSGRDKRSPILVLSPETASKIIDNFDDGSAADDVDALTTIRNLLAADTKIKIVNKDNKTTVRPKDDMKIDVDDDELEYSGNKTLNFTGDDAATDPMDIDVNIRFFGCTVVKANNSCDLDKNGTVISSELQDISSSIEIDEDGSSGENSDANVSPWIAVNGSVPTGKKIIIYAIYFETSKKEILLGGTKYHSCSVATHRLVDRGGTTGWMCDPDASGDDGDDVPTNKATTATDVVFTANEKSNNDALVVKASADGNQKSVNLYLEEKGQFKGVYQGHLRLTDSDGDGSADKDDTKTAGIDESMRQNWGLDVGDGTDNTVANAAVLGVESGPVTISYKDSDGKSQSFTIMIDNEPPTIEIDSPSNGSSSGDQSPDFIGSFNDAVSGLVNDSFRLVVDNSVGDENNGKNKEFALKNRAPTADIVTSGTKAMVDDESDYKGYSDAASTIGVVEPDRLYKLGDDSCSDSALCYIEADTHDDGAKAGKFDDTIKLDLQDGTKDADTRDAEFEIDFQAFVMDMAGNIGFSDSDISNPRFINDLGEKAQDDDGNDLRKVPNVLGWYSAHIFTLDEKDPTIIENQSATGFYGHDSDKKMNIVDRSGILVVFDGAVRPNTVTTNTFTVTLDDKTAATVTDVTVDKNLVFLKLASELASDATPEIDIANGQAVEDMAGNETAGREVDAFDVKDGISPRLTVTLSGGSGSGTGDEDSTNLTKDKMVVHVASDEPLSGVPRISVVCSSLVWYEGDKADMKHDIDDFVDNRSGAFGNEPSEEPAKKTPLTTNTKAVADNASHEYTCGYDQDKNNFNDEYLISKVSGSSRPGENWEFTWQVPTDDPTSSRYIADGKVTAVAFGRDTSTYKNSKNKDLENWGSASDEFRLDTILHSPLAEGKGEVQPADGGSTKEARPYVLIEFADNSSVTLSSVEVDDVEVASKFEQPISNRFVYWPASLSKGDHDVVAKAIDAAGNDRVFEWSFKSEDRGDFIMNILAGWNAVSVPAHPVDTSIASVFTDRAITTVIGWDTSGWRIAVRRDGVWESNQQYAPLNEIRAGYGYWVKSSGFVKQAVSLAGRDVSRSTGTTPMLIAIPTEPGWNFVGVVDQDGDQTEDNFGDSLKDSSNEVLSATEYLGENYVRAYSWEPTFARFDTIRGDNDVNIGSGIWVYYPEGTGIAP